MNGEYFWDNGIFDKIISIQKFLPVQRLRKAPFRAREAGEATRYFCIEQSTWLSCTRTGSGDSVHGVCLRGVLRCKTKKLVCMLQNEENPTGKNIMILVSRVHFCLRLLLSNVAVSHLT